MKKTLILRAECLIDITRFLHNVFYANEAKWISNIPSFQVYGTILKLDIDNDDLDLNYFKNMAANVVDGHIMLETMSFGDSFSKRTYDSFLANNLTFDCPLTDGKSKKDGN